MNIERYRLLKESINRIKFWGLEDVAAGDALSIPISYLGGYKDYTAAKIIAAIISMAFTITYDYKIEYHGENDKKKVMFFFAHSYIERNDYIDIMNKVKSLYPERCDFYGKNVGNKFKRKLSLKMCRYLLYIPAWIYQTRKLPCSLTDRLVVIKDIFEAKIWHDFVVKEINADDFSALIVFFDARLYDNLLVQHFKNHDVPTASLQHGHFLATKPTAECRNEIGLCFEGFISDKMFVWGKYTKNEAVKNGIEPSRIVITGCPKYIGLREMEKNNDGSVFGIVLEGEGKVNYAANVELIKLANETAKNKSMKYVIKPHPVSDMTMFEEFIDKRFLYRIAGKGESVEEYSKTVDFSLVMGSSVYIELLYLGHAVFRFVCSSCRDSYESIKSGIVRNAGDFMELIDEFKRNPQKIIEMNRKSSEMLCERGNTKENYLEAINYLINLK